MDAQHGWTFFLYYFNDEKLHEICLSIFHFEQNELEIKWKLIQKRNRNKVRKKCTEYRGLLRYPVNSFSLYIVYYCIYCSCSDSRMVFHFQFLSHHFLPSQRIQFDLPSATKKSIESQRWPLFALSFIHSVLASTAIVTSIQYPIQAPFKYYKRIEFVCSGYIRSCSAWQKHYTRKNHASNVTQVNNIEDEDGRTDTQTPLYTM